MEQKKSASFKELDSKVSGNRSSSGASPHLGRAAISGLVAASLVLFGVLYVGFRSHSLDAAHAAVRNQNRLQQNHAATLKNLSSPNSTPRLMDAAFAMPSSSAKSDSSAALIAKGKQLFQAHTCSACHGPKAQGTAIAPPLAGIGHYFDEATFSDLIHHPRPPMTAKGMPPAPLSDKETHALWTYLNSMPVPAHRAPGVPAVKIFKKAAAKAPKSTTPHHAIAAIRSQHRNAATSA